MVKWRGEMEKMSVQQVKNFTALLQRREKRQFTLYMVYHTHKIIGLTKILCIYYIKFIEKICKEKIYIEIAVHIKIVVILTNVT